MQPSRVAHRCRTWTNETCAYRYVVMALGTLHSPSALLDGMTRLGICWPSCVDVQLNQDPRSSGLRPGNIKQGFSSKKLAAAGPSVPLLHDISSMCSRSSQSRRKHRASSDYSEPKKAYSKLAPRSAPPRRHLSLAAQRLGAEFLSQNRC